MSKCIEELQEKHDAIKEKSYKHFQKGFLALNEARRVNQAIRLLRKGVKD